jgi:hypothetical protein
MLADALTILRWESSHDELLNDAQDRFVHLLAGLLGAVLARLERTRPDLAAEILQHAADPDCLRRVLIAPAASSRLLWAEPGAHSDEALGTFLADSLQLELARRANVVPNPINSQPADGLLWTALGDGCFDIGRSRWIQQPHHGGLTVDTISPAAIQLDSVVRIGSGLHPYHDSAQQSTALTKLEAAMRSLDDHASPVAAFVRRFTLVTNIVADAEIARFSSGSTNQHIGRSIFWNAHLPAVDVGTVAEGLVHEAVHSLLYMNEACSPWLLDPEDPDTAHTLVISPWSGATLTLQPFLQACFVWYALAHFWNAAHETASLPSERIHSGITTALAGFQKGPLIEHIPTGPTNITPELLDLLHALQTDVTRAHPTRTIRSTANWRLQR